MNGFFDLLVADDVAVTLDEDALFPPDDCDSVVVVLVLVARPTLSLSLSFFLFLFLGGGRGGNAEWKSEDVTPPTTRFRFSVLDGIGNGVYGDDGAVIDRGGGGGCRNDGIDCEMTKYLEAFGAAVAIVSDYSFRSQIVSLNKRVSRN
jgi:hypothetical protein